MELNPSTKYIHLPAGAACPFGTQSVLAVLEGYLRDTHGCTRQPSALPREGITVAIVVAGWVADLVIRV